jgi:hypothetical protein
VRRIYLFFWLTGCVLSLNQIKTSQYRMGNTGSFPAPHIRIYQNTVQIRDPQKRAEMIQTLLAGPEYVNSAKRAGIYANLLGYVSKVQKGQYPDPLPG